jgi:hypothetical protein
MAKNPLDSQQNRAKVASMNARHPEPLQAVLDRRLRSNTC